MLFLLSIGVRSESKNHNDAVNLLRSLMKGEKVKLAANHLSKLVYSKNMVEYESRLFKQEEAYALVKHATKFMNGLNLFYRIKVGQLEARLTLSY